MLREGLFPILDENYSGDIECATIIEAFLDSEVIPFIVRNKSLSPEEYLIYINEINLLKSEMDFDFLVHHHIEAFKQSDAVGIHLTAESKSVAEVRAELGPSCLIGYSAHSLDEALDAKRSGADYILLGAVFDTPKSNPDHPILGVETLKLVCRKVEVPVYAIGGISSENLLAVCDAGAAGFSALRAVYQNDEIEHNVSKLEFLWNDLV